MYVCMGEWFGASLILGSSTITITEDNSLFIKSLRRFINRKIDRIDWEPRSNTNMM